MNYQRAANAIGAIAAALLLLAAIVTAGWPVR